MLIFRRFLGDRLSVATSTGFAILLTLGVVSIETFMGFSFFWIVIPFLGILALSFFVLTFKNAGWPMILIGGLVLLIGFVTLSRLYPLFFAGLRSDFPTLMGALTAVIYFILPIVLLIGVVRFFWSGGHHDMGGPDFGGTWGSVMGRRGGSSAGGQRGPPRGLIRKVERFFEHFQLYQSTRQEFSQLGAEEQARRSGGMMKARNAMIREAVSIQNHRRYNSLPPEMKQQVEAAYLQISATGAPQQRAA